MTIRALELACRSALQLLTGEIEIGSDQRRAAQRGKDCALPWRFVSNHTTNSRSYPRGIPAAFGKPNGQASDQLAVGVQAKNLKSRQTALGQARPTISRRSNFWGYRLWQSPKRLDSNHPDHCYMHSKAMAFPNVQPVCGS